MSANLNVDSSVQAENVAVLRAAREQNRRMEEMTLGELLYCALVLYPERKQANPTHSR
jgi:hypothetical protein